METNDLQQPVTKEYLGQFTEDVLLPAISNLVREEMKPLEKRLDRVEQRLNTDMVTKEYLDDKLGDLKADIIVMMRKEDQKLNLLVDVLRQKQLLSNEEAEQVLALRPFVKT